MMTYDDWKLETPEDEYARKHGHPYLCPECSETWEETITGHCVNCDARLSKMRDPDDARDDAQDREWNR
jgi:hypothetical protein